MNDSNIFVQISIIYCMVHMYIFLFFFYEYRCSKRTFRISAAIVFFVISAVCLWIMFTQGIAVMGEWGVLIGSVPTLIFFFVMSRQRNAQFIFIFCFSDTVCMWLELTTALIDYAVKGGGVVTLILRVVSFPILEYVVWRWLRRPFLKISRTVKKGWLLFAALTGVCYLILVLLSVYPTLILERPQDMPLAVMVLILIALAYCTIFCVLFEQLYVLEARERQQVLEAQANMMSRRIEESRRAEETIRIERHDMRHQLQTVATFAKQGDIDGLLDYVGASQDSLDTTKSPVYCQNPIIDAVLFSASEQAREVGATLELAVALPEKLTVDPLELSIVFANALENAIQAVGELPEGHRRVICKSVTAPRFMIEIANPYAGEVRFDRQGLPIADTPGHGIGTRSIMAFADKYKALCQFRAENGWFKVQLAV